MTDGGEPSLAERRLSLRADLRAQRAKVAGQLESADRNGYPRSITMRLLIRRPELLARLASIVAGGRFTGPVSALLVVLQTLSWFAEIAPRGRLAIQQVRAHPLNSRPPAEPEI